jgi:Fuc2NAc and GlcNAc transferase
VSLVHEGRVLILALALASLVCTVAMTPVFRAGALRFGFLDRPNPRSSHRSVTPRGGGVAIILAVGICLWVAWPSGTGEAQAAAFWGGASLLGIVGLLDDRFGVSSLIRLACQLLAAGAVSLVTGGFTRLPLPPPLDVHVGSWGVPLAILWIVAVVNFYNFLDGIDGLAALQGAITGLGLALAGWDAFATALGAALAGGCLGFLFFNWSPAKVFLGDVGSSFLGYTFAVLPILAPERTRGAAVLFVGMSLWLFLADATATLLRRLARGERWDRPHREHLYQRLVARGWTHARVAAGIGLGSAVLTGMAVLSWQAQVAQWAWVTLMVALGLFAVEWMVVKRQERASG